ncbi:hypothetical protein Gotri_001474 [Gossypium trilobum]|uniref:Uncharacterized protein n=1 Tax=Gossypium trilobum TaxID=34281 RepID=A0A7J9FET7_9ROSI|nr:hypothetical protein [Gossypium trilobum]
MTLLAFRKVETQKEFLIGNYKPIFCGVPLDYSKPMYALLRKKANIKRAKMGYPLLFVCMVALISVYIGYLLAPLTKSKASMSDLYQQMQ